MFIITHAVTGMVIGQVVKSSPLAFIIGWIVHFIMDIIPHGDSNEYKKYKKTNIVPKGQLYQIIFDNLVMFALIAYFLIFRVENAWWPTFWGILGSVLPDALVGIHECKPNRLTRPFHRLHFFFHNLITDRRQDMRLRYALILQLIAIIILMRLI
jgi:hypothetical protein